MPPVLKAVQGTISRFFPEDLSLWEGGVGLDWGGLSMQGCEGEDQDFKMNSKRDALLFV